MKVKDDSEKTGLKSCVDHNKLWKILKEMGIPDHLTCLLRNLYAGQEATVRTGHGLARYSVSREVPCSVLKWETVLGSLDATPKFP